MIFIMSEIKRYTSPAEVQDFWINKIAPNYFDFDKVNNYRSGIFGYINEVMSTVTMDTHNAINIARREFYPVSAQNPQSMYKMAILQHVGLPMATPGTCRAVIILDEDEVIQNATYKNGNYTCVIDNTTEITADVIPFSILYPIVIIASRSNYDWTFSIHYDKSGKNDMDQNSSAYYLNHKIIKMNGRNYLMIEVQLYQAERESISELVTSDAMVQTVSINFEFDGDLANFEVYYIEEPDVSTPIHLTKVMKGLGIPTTPFCQYTMLDSNTLQLIFPKNIYFTPELNSEIRVDVYTSLGKQGEFDSFEGDLTCEMESEQYPYNNNMTMMGVIDGPCIGASNIPTQSEYMRIIQDAYATNHTIATEHDLQIQFDRLANNTKNRIRFRKKRLDCFREYGAYILLKDENDNVIPTNSLTVSLRLDEFDIHNGVSQDAIIKPGALFEYDPKTNTSSLYKGMRIDIEKEEEIEELDDDTESDASTQLTLSSDLSEFDSSNSRFIYTNPFLIMATLFPNVVGYYNNSINETHSVEYEYVNDESIVQFIGSNLKIYRNSLNKENFYKFSFTISPTVDIEVSQIVEIPTPPVIEEGDENGENLEEDSDYYFRAEQSGRILSIEYDEESGVVCTIEYDDGETDVIQVSTIIEPDDTDPDNITYSSGYTLTKDVYDTFVEGDILGIAKVTDKGKIRACMQFKGHLDTASLYVPMAIEEYNAELNTFTLVGYMSTDDALESGSILIDHGIFNEDGHEDDNISIPSSGLKALIHVFYNYDDQNQLHNFSSFEYFKTHTMTNTYIDVSETGIDLISPITFIRSTMTFEEPDDTGDIDDEDEVVEDDGDDYIITIHEMPVVKANWLKETENFNYLIREIMTDYRIMQELYLKLQGNHSIDMKFYNTYGKSRFFRVGIQDNWRNLENVNLSFRFGVYLSSVTNQSTFLSKFRSYVKARIEEINGDVGTAQSLYIMNLIHDIKEQFSEIGYLEYYGFDKYSYDVQKIEPLPSSKMSPQLLSGYIPEFVNITTTFVNGENTPLVDVIFLDSAVVTQ